MTALLAIESGGSYIDLPSPNENGYSTNLQELSKSSRNALGNLYKFRINMKQTIEVEWNLTAPEDKNLITRLTRDNSFQVRYFDTEDSTIKYGRFYRGSDYKVTPQIRYVPDKGEFMYYNIKMSMVEF